MFVEKLKFYLNRLVGVPKEEGSGPVAGDPGWDADGCGHGDED